MEKQNQSEEAIGKVEIVFVDHDHNNQVLAIARLEGDKVFLVCPDKHFLDGGH